MSTDTFNPYTAWLGLRVRGREPNYYELLGLRRFEADEAAIRAAADAVRAKLLPHLNGAHAVAAESLVAHINRAERCLLNKKRKQLYDDQLRAEMALLPPDEEPSDNGREDACSRESANASQDATAIQQPGSDVAAASGPTAAPAAWGMPAGASVPQALPPSAFLSPGAGGSPSATSPLAGGGVKADDDAPPLAALGLDSVVPSAAPTAYGSPPLAGSGADPLPAAATPAYVPQVPPVDAPLVPAAVQPAAPAAGSEPAVAVRGTPSVRRAARSRGPNWFFLAGIPVALVVILTLTAMWAMQAGPFAPGSGNGTSGNGQQVAHNTAGESSLGNPPTRPATGTGSQPPAESSPMGPGTSGSSGTPGTGSPSMGTSGSSGSQPSGPSGADTPPMPVPTPMPMPEPVPAPMPVPPTPPPQGNPAPPPMPNPPVEPDPAAVAAARTALQAARYYLAHRDLDRAQEQLTLASRTDTSRALGAELQRVQHMHNYVSEFWKAVRRAVGALTPGDQITIQDITVGVVEILPNGVILRRNGRNERHTYDDMKSGLALGLAESVLDRGDPVTHIVLGAFLAVNPTSQREEARAAWERARQMGAADEVALLLPELDVVIPESLESVPGTPAPSPMAPMPLKVPSAEQIAAAREQIRKTFRVEFFDATTPEAKRSLVTQLLVASEEAADAALRYAYFLEAMRVSVEAGDYDRAFLLADDLAKIFPDAPLMDLKAEALEGVVKSSDDIPLNRTITEKYLELSDEARLREQFTVALRIIRLAQITARKTRDAALIKEVNDRLREVQEVMRAP